MSLELQVFHHESKLQTDNGARREETTNICTKCHEVHPAVVKLLQSGPKW